MAQGGAVRRVGRGAELHLLLSLCPPGKGVLCLRVTRLSVRVVSTLYHPVRPYVFCTVIVFEV